MTDKNRPSVLLRGRMIPRSAPLFCAALAAGVVADANLAAGVVAGADLGAAPIAPAASVQNEPVRIVLENGTEPEQAAEQQLRRLLDTVDVDRWVFTREVRIAAMETPHSHPVLTVNTKYLDDDNRQLSTFLHEQFHWWVISDGRAEHLQRAIDEFAERYPETPPREEGGASDQRSNYLHLVVCDLELQAMTALIGESAAHELIATQDHYQWIYDKVLNDPSVREINTRHGFIVP